MLKKILLILMLFITVSVFAQLTEGPPRFDKGVLSLDGNDWVTTTSSNKQAFLTGMFFGLDMTRAFLITMQESENFAGWLNDEYGNQVVAASPEGIGSPGSQVEAVYDLLGMLVKWALYENTSNDIIILLDQIYKEPKNREYSILEILLVEYKKSWWKI